MHWISEPNPYALYFPDNPHYHFWQYLSSMFMHGGITHLLFNMLALWMFGSALERYWGSIRFLIFYLICGIGAGFIYNEINVYQFNHVQAQLLQEGAKLEYLQHFLKTSEYFTNISDHTKELLFKYYDLYNIPTVGASGAIYGILVAYAYNFPNNKLMLIFLPYPIPAKYFVPILLLIDLFSGVTGFSIFGSNVAHFAHIGGAIVGGLLMFFLGRNPDR
jgi:membrane associated rhomboid family serine protease